MELNRHKIENVEFVVLFNNFLTCLFNCFGKHLNKYILLLYVSQTWFTGFKTSLKQQPQQQKVLQPHTNNNNNQTRVS